MMERPCIVNECITDAGAKIYALKDQSNNGVAKGDKFFPLALFFLIFGLGACFGWETGYASMQHCNPLHETR